MAAEAKTSKGGRRLWLISPIVALFLAAGVWCAGWWGITVATESHVNEWLDQERALGRHWACSQREVNGFPFRIAITCDSPILVGDVNGEQIEGRLHALRAEADLYQPNHIVAEAESPLIGRDLRGGRLSLDWAVLKASIVGDTTALERLSLNVEKLNARVTPALWGESDARAAHAQIDLGPALESPADAKAYDLAVRLDEAVIAGFDAFVGSDIPANMVLIGTLSQAEFAAKGTVAERLERWRLAGGKFDITSLLLNKGGMHVQARGQVRLDELHRPSGQFEAELAGIEPLLIRLGLPAGAVRLGNLSNLLSGVVEQKPAAPGSNEKMRLKLTLDKGRLMVGPIPMGILQPLY